MSKSGVKTVYIYIYMFVITLPSVKHLYIMQFGHIDEQINYVDVEQHKSRFTAIKINIADSIS